MLKETYPSKKKFDIYGMLSQYRGTTMFVCGLASAAIVLLPHDDAKYKQPQPKLANVELLGNNLSGLASKLDNKFVIQADALEQTAADHAHLGGEELQDGSILLKTRNGDMLYGNDKDGNRVPVVWDSFNCGDSCFVAAEQVKNSSGNVVYAAGNIPVVLSSLPKKLRTLNEDAQKLEKIRDAQMDTIDQVGKTLNIPWGLG